ncbi:hypothetical protein RRG08_045592 [Elysia crispata]|uniref:Uncharacterized protein n=1 Tax=Elysia crispata TaxID=231223 RepID=A0AAE1DWB7_9GAST|nr:hypothetical protein RRG08_045592 [Elysia crispata]
MKKRRPLVRREMPQKPHRPELLPKLISVARTPEHRSKITFLQPSRYLDIHSETVNYDNNQRPPNMGILVTSVQEYLSKMPQRGPLRQ